MIAYQDLQRAALPHIDEIAAAADKVIRGGWYLKGEATRRFEANYARYIGSRYCVGCGNGLDALTLILRAYMALGRLNEGDEVIVPANTYIASILSITENRLRPVLVEPSLETLQIDERLAAAAITPKTKAIMIVHLYGRCAYSPRIGELCREHGLLLIEDNAQAHGCRCGDRLTGSIGHAAAHSFYPGKNLGAMGDAGAITTNDAELADTARAMGNYGSEKKYVFGYQGRNSRIDEVQAAILDVKLQYLDDENRRRKALADYYLKHITNPYVTLPARAATDSVWHIFPILCATRDELQEYLLRQGVQTLIHYPIPPHRQQCYSAWAQLRLPITERIHREELSLPIAPYLTDDEAAAVAAAVNGYRPSRGKRP